MRHETGDMSGDARPKDLSSLDSRLTPSASLRFTLKAWPVITLVTIGLSFATQQVAEWCGVQLPEQQNIEVVKRCLSAAFSSAKAFGVAAFLVARVVVLLPAVEECVFRWMLFMLPKRILVRRHGTRDQASGCARMNSGVRSFDCSLIVFSSVLFSAAHYIAQPWPDNAFLALFFFGLAQCWLYRRTDRLWCAILNHALFNLTNLVLLFVVPA